MAREETENEAVDGAPCADSELTLKERMAKLDDMELADGNKSIGDKTDNAKLVA